MDIRNDSGGIEGNDLGLAALKLVDAEVEQEFDAITKLAHRLFETPVSLVSIVEEAADRQYFKSHIGLGEPWASARQTPLSHSFCQYVKRDDKPLAVTDAATHPLVKENLAIRDLNVVAYLGVPIHGPDKKPIGALCVIDSKPREWTIDHIEMLQDLARCVDTEIAIRANLKLVAGLHLELHAKNERICRQNRMRETIALAFMAPDLAIDQRFISLLKSTSEMAGMQYGSLTRIDGEELHTLYTSSPDNPTRFAWMKDSLAGLVARGQEIIVLASGASSNNGGRTNAAGEAVECYMGVPLVMQGVFFGVMEFSSAFPKVIDEEEWSIFSIAGIFACAQLSIFEQQRRSREREKLRLEAAVNNGGSNGTGTTGQKLRA